MSGSRGYRLNIDDATVVLFIVNFVMVPKRVSSTFFRIAGTGMAASGIFKLLNSGRGEYGRKLRSGAL